ncbi:hypothetical protein [Desulfomarina sp.]
MKLIIRILIPTVLLIAWSVSLNAGTTDSIIKNARADIARLEQQATGLTSSRASNVRRILKLTTLAHRRLENSSDHGDPVWKEVNQRFLSLENLLLGLLNPKENTKNSQHVKATVSKNTPAQPGHSVAPLVSGQRVQVKKLARDINSVTDGLSTSGPSILQSPEKIKAYQKRMKQFANALGRYPQTDDPDVRTARKNYARLVKKLSDEFKRAKKQLTQLGNVQERLITIQANSRKYTVPRVLPLPFSMEQAETWVQEASNARTVAEHNIRELNTISRLAYFPDRTGPHQPGHPFDGNDVIQLLRNMENNLKSVENNYKTMAEGLKYQMLQIEKDVLSRYQENPDSDKRWLFISEGREKEIFTLYDKSMAIAQSSIYLERALGRTPEQALELVKKINQAKKDFIRKRDIALETSKLPPAKSKDKKLLAIAKSIVEKKKYGFGEHGRIILTSDKIADRERKESEIKIDKADISLGGDLKMSGTQTTWTYRWKEFRFAVPLKEPGSDIWYIWWITAKNFSAGGPRTPLNQWISGKADKGNRILAKNL